MRRHGKRQSEQRLGSAGPNRERPVDRRLNPTGLSNKSLAVAAVVGVFVVVLAWWVGPSMFATSAAPQQRAVRATVVDPVPCTKPGARETVSFQWQGKARTGTLMACGHAADEQLDVAVPVNAGSGVIEVDSVASSSGHSALVGPIGLLLLAFSCAAGGIYAFLVVRGPRTRMAPAAA